MAEGGITIKGMFEKLKNNSIPLADKLIVFLGTNDFLKYKPIVDMQTDYDNLVEYLLQQGKRLVLLTIPPIPSIEKSRDYHDRIMTFNDHLKIIAMNSEHVQVVDLNAVLMTKQGDSNSIDLDCFEKVYKFKNKIDLVHLNRQGLIKMKQVLDEFFDSHNNKSVMQNRLFLNSDNSEELIDESHYHDHPVQPAGSRLPEIEIKIGTGIVKATVDCGSEATIVSEEFYEMISSNLSERSPELPVSNVSIVGVTGNKAKKVSFQAQLEIDIDNVLIPVTCFIVKGIHVNFLLGVDFIRKYNAILDFGKHTMTITSNDISHEIKFVSKDINVNQIRIIQSNRTCIYHDEVEGEGSMTLNHLCNAVETTIKSKEQLVKNPITSNHQLIDKIAEIQNNSNISDPIIFEKLSQTLLNNQAVFSDEPGLIKGFTAKLNVKTDKPFVGKSYGVPYSKREEVAKELERMQATDLIEQSSSPYTNPLVCVIKKDGSIRLCLDSRKLNSCLEADNQGPELTDEIFQKFVGKKFYTSLDLAAGFLQVNLDPESRKYVAFTFGGRNFNYKRLPFGTSVSTALFVKAMCHVFGPEYRDFLTIYVDDILITSNTAEEHVDHINQVLSRLRECGATVKLKKSEFFRSEVKFLGFILGAEGLREDPDKIKKIQDFPEPKNLKELQSFLGMANYYRRFHNKYAELTAQLSHVMSSKKQWKWGEEERKIFQDIKSKFLECVMLKHPDWTKPLYLNTDASKISISAILFQYDDEGNEQVISFACRSLNPCETRYSITELELLSIVYACKKLRIYLIGHHTNIVKTDHKALTFLRNCKLTYGRLFRWSLFLQEYNLQIEFIPGKENIAADVLSRVSDADFEKAKEDNCIKVYRNQFNSNYDKKQLKGIFKDLGVKQISDEFYGPIVNTLKDTDVVAGKIHDNYTLYKEILFLRKQNDPDNIYRVCIPEVIKHDLINLIHLKYGHAGGRKVYLILREVCVFPRMEKDIVNFLKRCDLCQKAKHDNKKAVGLLQPVIARKIGELVAIDLIGELPIGRFGNKYILSIIDVFSKFVQLFPLRKATTRTIINKITKGSFLMLKEIKAVLTDHGSQFTSHTWYDKLQELGIKTLHTSVYHPGSNPVERCNKEIGKIIRMYCYDKHTRWVETLGFIEDCLNHSVHCTTEQKPHEIFFGRPLVSFIDELIDFPTKRNFDHDKKIVLVRQNLLSKAEKRKLNHDKKIKPVTYNVGDLVLVKSHELSNKIDKKIKKFFLLYYGPFVVTEVKMTNAYRLRELNNDRCVGVFNTNQLKRYFSQI